MKTGLVALCPIHSLPAFLKPSIRNLARKARGKRYEKAAEKGCTFSHPKPIRRSAANPSSSTFGKSTACPLATSNNMRPPSALAGGSSLRFWNTSHRRLRDSSCGSGCPLQSLPLRTDFTRRRDARTPDANKAGAWLEYSRPALPRSSHDKTHALPRNRFSLPNANDPRPPAIGWWNHSHR